MALPEPFEGEPRGGHEGGGGAPVAAHVAALPRGEDRAPVVHHHDDRHPRPALALRVTTSTTAKPRSTGAVAQSISGMPAEKGRRSAGASSGKASGGASSATDAVARATSWVMSWSTARPDSISTRVGGRGDR